MRCCLGKPEQLIHNHEHLDPLVLPPIPASSEHAENGFRSAQILPLRLSS